MFCYITSAGHQVCFIYFRGTTGWE